MIARDQKFQVGGSLQTFFWVASRAGGIVGVSVTVHHPTLGDISVPMSVIASPINVASIGDDRRTLTLSAPVAGVEGLQGDQWGSAILATSEASQYEVRIASASGSTVVLDDPIPRDVTLGTPAILAWATFSCTLPAATVLSVAARDIPWTVTYTTASGDSPSSTHRDLGLLHVVAQPFRTGLTTSALVQLFPRMAKPVPRTADGWGPQIEAAEALLVERVRRTLLPQGKWEDDIPSAQRLQLAHAHLAISLILSEQDIDKSDAMMERGYQMADDVLRRIWVDQDGNLDPTEGGTDEHLGGVPAQSGSAFTSAPTREFSTSTRWW